MFLDKNKVGDLILELGLVDQEDFDLAEQEAKDKGTEIHNILIRKGLLNEQELQSIYMRMTDVSYIDLKNKKIDPIILTVIPEPIVRKYNVVAFDKDDRDLKVAILDLGNLDKIDFLKKKVSLRIVPYLTDRPSLNRVVLQYQDLLKNDYGSQIQNGFLSFQTISEDALKGLSREQILEISRSKQVNNVFELLIRHALLQKVSNIHIEPQEDNVLIRYRIGGDLYSSMVLPKKSAFILSLKIKTLAGLRLSDSKSSQNGRFQVGFDGKDVDFRVHTLPLVWGEKIVLNILQLGDSGFSFEAVGFHGKALDLLYTTLEKRKKMVLIVGPKNSGRTTTFYTILDLLKSPDLNISTVEETIGFQMNGISQTVILPKDDFDVINGIEQVIKQDCDVVAVDEVGKLELALAKNSFLKLAKVVDDDRFVSVVAETKLGSTSKIISELINRSDFLPLLNSLDLVILQRLVPELVSDKKEYYLSVSEIKKIAKLTNLDKVMKDLVEEGVLTKQIPWSEVKFFKSLTENNKDKKIMVSEVVKVNSLMKGLLMEKVPSEKIKKECFCELLTLNEDLLFKAVQGLVSVDEVL